ncbi:hypothetical protein SRHO_G00029000 [Serrasalmus rhombeus]
MQSLSCWQAIKFCEWSQAERAEGALGASSRPLQPGTLEDSQAGASLHISVVSFTAVDSSEPHCLSEVNECRYSSSFEGNLACLRVGSSRPYLLVLLCSSHLRRSVYLRMGDLVVSEEIQMEVTAREFHRPDVPADRETMPLSPPCK